MHEELFLSADRPFRATPDSRFYFGYESIESARQTVIRAVLRAEGPVMVVGGAGLGKSLLGMVITEGLEDRFDVVKLHAARLCSRRALLQSILFELQLPYRDLSEGDLRLSILSRLEPSSQHAPDGILIVVDEAHTLPAKLLDELRLITNYTRGNQPRARLVLIGNLRLEHTFAEPQMESFNQRLAARCYLQPMNRQQTRDYVYHQLTVAGFKPKELITDDAIHSVYAASEGVPRLTNQIMDHALALAVTGSQCPVSSALIEEAWADLQQLPAPWHAGADRLPNSADKAATMTGGGAASTVEFGALDDDDDWGVPGEQSIDPPTSQTRVTQIPAAACSKTNLATLECDDSDEDLRLADDPLEATTNTRKSNFFAAFIPPDDESKEQLENLAAIPNDPSYAEVFENDSTELDLAPEGLGIVSGAASRGRQEESETDFLKYRAQAGTLALAGDSFFCNRATDEQLLAIEDEQQGYDAMGVWENDPPIVARARDVESIEPLPAASKLVASQLFGEDFEEEESLSIAFATGGANASPKPTLQLLPINDFDSAAEHSARQASDVVEYVERIEEFAHSVAGANRVVPGVSAPTVDEVLAESHFLRDNGMLAELGSSTAVLDTWSLDVAAIDVNREIAVHNEIEDLVSQLNFAAFSVEPFSVEQIVIEPRDQKPSLPKDFSRSGKNDEIYTMHRPRELPAVANEIASLHNYSADDDRDLLVIEEELPQSTPSADASQRPVTKIAPYSQLFAKLRR